MENEKLTTYTFYFTDGTLQTGDGLSVSNAFSKLGNSHMDIVNVDVYEESTPSGAYIYNEITKIWDTVAI